MTPDTDALVALRKAKELIDYALPKFNWGASALDAKAIALLNEVPAIVNATLIDAPQTQCRWPSCDCIESLSGRSCKAAQQKPDRSEELTVAYAKGREDGLRAAQQNSRSQLRRLAAQTGEEAPDFSQQKPQDDGWVKCSSEKGARRNALYIHPDNLDCHLCTERNGVWYSRRPLPPLPKE